MVSVHDVEGSNDDEMYGGVLTANASDPTYEYQQSGLAAPGGTAFAPAASHLEPPSPHVPSRAAAPGGLEQPPVPARSPVAPGAEETYEAPSEDMYEAPITNAFAGSPVSTEAAVANGSAPPGSASDADMYEVPVPSLPQGAPAPPARRSSDPQSNVVSSETYEVPVCTVLANTPNLGAVPPSVRPTDSTEIHAQFDISHISSAYNDRRANAGKHEVDDTPFLAGAAALEAAGAAVAAAKAAKNAVRELPDDIDESFTKRGLETKLKHHAARGEYERVESLLRDKRILINATRVGGSRQTPLHVASREGYSKVVRMLLTAKANPHKRDAQGRTPLVCIFF